MDRKTIATVLVHAVLWPVWFTLTIVVVTLMLKWAVFVSGLVM